jgi:hypothetical protein
VTAGSLGSAPAWAPSRASGGGVPAGVGDRRRRRSAGTAHWSCGRRSTAVSLARCRGSAQRGARSARRVPGRASFEVTRITITEPNPSGSNVDAVFEAGYAAGAARFNRLEGMFDADRSIVFVSTSGGNVENGDVDAADESGRASPGGTARSASTPRRGAPPTARRVAGRQRPVRSRWPRTPSARPNWPAMLEPGRRAPLLQHLR